MILFGVMCVAGALMSQGHVTVRLLHERAGLLLILVLLRIGRFVKLRRFPELNTGSVPPF